MFIHSGELGNRRPIQLMEAMLAVLPPGEEDSILFKTLYITKLPKEVRGHVLANGMHLDSRELSELANNLWCGLNERHSGAKSHHVAAAVPDDSEELAEAVAALNVQPKHPQHKKTATKGGKSQGKQPPKWATLAVFSTWWLWPAPSSTWWTLAAPTASYPTSLQLSPLGHA